MGVGPGHSALCIVDTIEILLKELVPILFIKYIESLEEIAKCLAVYTRR